MPRGSPFFLQLFLHFIFLYQKCFIILYSTKTIIMSLYDNKLFTELDRHELLELVNKYIEEGNYMSDDEFPSFEDSINHYYGYGYEFTKKDVLDYWEGQMFAEHVLESYYEYKYL